MLNKYTLLRLITAILTLVVILFFTTSFWSHHGLTRSDRAEITYNKDGTWELPKNYREWVFLSSGIDMVYGPKSADASAHSVFDNVFVNPVSYSKFLTDGKWPNKTIMVLEMREGERNASINQAGQTQGARVLDIEVHLKDKSRFAGGWAFFAVNSAGTGKLITKPAVCYTCHQNHAAVDKTFVQFYPTLLEIARRKSTLSNEYLQDVAHQK